MAGARRILVGIPVYCGWDHVADALDSLRAQTFREFDVLISVDGADERSAAACRRHAGDGRVQIVVQERRLGWAGNYNALFAACGHEFFFGLSQDDRLDPACLERLLAAADARPDAAIVYPEEHGFGSQTFRLRAPSVEGPALQRMLELTRRFVWTAFHGLVRLPALREAGRLRLTELDSAAEDHVWVMRAARAGPLLRVPGAIYCRRMHAASTSLRWRRWGHERRQEVAAAICAGMLEAANPAAPTRDEFRLVYRAVLDRLAVDAPLVWMADPARRRTLSERVRQVDALLERVESDGAVDLAARLGTGREALRARSVARVLFRAATHPLRLRLRAWRRPGAH